MRSGVICQMLVLVFFTTLCAHTLQAEESAKDTVVELRELLATQEELVTKIKADFHRLKYELPYNHVKQVIGLEKFVKHLDTNGKKVQQLLGQVETIEPAAGNSVMTDGEMTAEQLTKWIKERSGCPESKYKALEKMLPYVTDLTPFNLDILVYTVTTDEKYKWDRRDVVELGKKLMAEKAQ